MPAPKDPKRRAEWIEEQRQRQLGKPSHRKGVSFEEEYGKERAEEIKEKISQKTITLYENPEYKGGLRGWQKRFTEYRRGKTWEELYGEKETKETKEKLSLNRKGKTYEEIYGEEKAKEIKEKLHIVHVKWQSDPKERERMRKMRLNHPKVSSIELKIQEELKKRGYKFVPQYSFEITLIDIAFLEKKVAIYLDGDYWHKLPGYKERDERCNKFLEESGWKVLRFWEHEIKGDLEGCMKRIEEVITIGR